MDLIGNNPITADGIYDMPVTPGKPHLFTLKGTFGGGTVTMTINSNVTYGTFDAVTGGAWTAEAEDTLIPSGSIVRLTVTGATTPSIRVNLIPIIES